MFNHQKVKQLLQSLTDGQPFRDADAARLQSSAYATLRIDRRGRIVFGNPAAACLFKLATVDELLNLSLTELFAQSQTNLISCALRSSLRNQTASTFDVMMRPQEDGYSEPLRLLLVPDTAPGSNVLGTVAVVQSQKIEHARGAIKQIAVAMGDWRSRLKTILVDVRALLPFDQATFGIYADNTTLYHPVHIEPEGRPWPAYWMKLQGDIKSWLNSGQTWEGDLNKFIKVHPALGDDPVVRLHLDYGIRSFVTVPVQGPNGPTSSLSFSSIRPNAYNRKDLSLIQSLGLVEILMMFEREIGQERRAFRQKMESQIRSGGSLKASAQALVNGLHDQFKWDHVSIMTVDGPCDIGTGEFKILCQAFAEGCGLPSDFRLPRSQGMLGATLDANPNPTQSEISPLIIEDTREVPRKHNYKPINPRLLSAMTYPLRLNKEWRWIITMQAAVTNAFHGPDIDALKEILTELEGELDRLYQAELNRVLLEKMPEGVIVVGPGGIIEKMNRSAEQRFLGLDGSEQARSLIEYAADATTREIVQGRLAVTSRRVVLRRADGELHAALATRNDLKDYQSSVWFLTDLDNLDWNIEYRYLRMVVNDVAQQTRGPLMLASTLMQKAVHELASEGPHKSVDGIVDRVLAEIGKADITFERLAEGLSIAKMPVRQRLALNLSDCVVQVIDGLPERDRYHVNSSRVERGIFVTGDAGRLRYAVRSMLGYLLRCRSDDDVIETKVDISLMRDKSDVALTLVLSSFRDFVGRQDWVPISSDPLLLAVTAARNDASVGREMIEQIITAHGGILTKVPTQIDRDLPASTWCGFWIVLPESTEGAND